MPSKVLITVLGTSCVVSAAGHAQDRTRRSACVCDPHAPSVAALMDGSNEHQQWIRKHSDQFSWMVLLEISRVSPIQEQSAKGRQTNNVEWETWADDEFTFPTTPGHDKPPLWKHRNEYSHGFIEMHPDPLRSITQSRLDMTQVRPPAAIASTMPLPPPGSGNQEVRRNQDSFQFITANSLWYREGLRDYANDPRSRAIEFPTRSIEIKAEWQDINGHEPYRHFHWNVDSKGKAYKLVGLHISTKALPEWTWATFEWVGNVGRCSWLDCRDSYGQTPSSVRQKSASGRYPAGRLCPDLVRRMRRSGIAVNEWMGYRLRGSQVLDHNTLTPTPVELGNSMMEGSVIPQSSCLACHLRARVLLKDGSPDCSLGVIDQSGIRPAAHLDYFSPGDLRTVDPQYYPTDFVWSFFRASPEHPNTPPTCTR